MEIEALPRWDVDRVRVDVDALAAWVLGAARQVDRRVTDLASLHEALAPAKARALAERLTRQSAERAPRALLRRAVNEALAQDEALAKRAASLWVQRVGVVRILVPGDDEAPLPLHADIRLGHAPDERNLWIALTDARASAALQAIDLAPSLAILARSASAFFDRDDNIRAAARARPVRRGDALWFTASHVHGATVNRTSATRVSIDIRLAPHARRGHRLRTGAVFVPLAAVPS